MSPEEQIALGVSASSKVSEGSFLDLSHSLKTNSIINLVTIKGTAEQPIIPKGCKEACTNCGLCDAKTTTDKALKTDGVKENLGGKQEDKIDDTQGEAKALGIDENKATSSVDKILESAAKITDNDVQQINSNSNPTSIESILDNYSKKTDLLRTGIELGNLDLIDNPNSSLTFDNKVENTSSLTNLVNKAGETTQPKIPKGCQEACTNCGICDAKEIGKEASKNPVAAEALATKQEDKLENNYSDVAKAIEVNEQKLDKFENIISLVNETAETTQPKIPKGCQEACTNCGLCDAKEIGKEASKNPVAAEALATKQEDKLENNYSDVAKAIEVNEQKLDKFENIISLVNESTETIQPKIPKGCKEACTNCGLCDAKELGKEALKEPVVGEALNTEQEEKLNDTYSDNAKAVGIDSTIDKIDEVISLINQDNEPMEYTEPLSEQQKEVQIQETKILAKEQLILAEDTQILSENNQKNLDFSKNTPTDAIIENNKNLDVKKDLESKVEVDIELKVINDILESTSKLAITTRIINEAQSPVQIKIANNLLTSELRNLPEQKSEIKKSIEVLSYTPNEPNQSTETRLMIINRVSDLLQKSPRELTSDLAQRIRNTNGKELSKAFRSLTDITKSLRRIKNETNLSKKSKKTVKALSSLASVLNDRATKNLERKQISSSSLKEATKKLLLTPKEDTKKIDKTVLKLVKEAGIKISKPKLTTIRKQILKAAKSKKPVLEIKATLAKLNRIERKTNISPKKVKILSSKISKYLAKSINQDTETKIRGLKKILGSKLANKLGEDKIEKLIKVVEDGIKKGLSITEIKNLIAKTLEDNLSHKVFSIDDKTLSTISSSIIEGFSSDLSVKEIEVKLKELFSLSELDEISELNLDKLSDEIKKALEAGADIEKIKEIISQHIESLNKIAKESEFYKKMESCLELLDLKLKDPQTLNIIIEQLTIDMNLDNISNLLNDILGNEVPDALIIELAKEIENLIKVHGIENIENEIKLLLKNFTSNQIELLKELNYELDAKIKLMSKEERSESLDTSLSEIKEALINGDKIDSIEFIEKIEYVIKLLAADNSISQEDLLSLLFLIAQLKKKRKRGKKGFTDEEILMLLETSPAEELAELLQALEEMDIIDKDKINLIKKEKEKKEEEKRKKKKSQLNQKELVSLKLYN